MKSALVTGSSKGIGAATAKLLKSHGYFVYLHGRHEEGLRQLEKQLGQEQSYFVADLENPRAIDQFIEDFQTRVAHHKARLQTLVNNAGIFAPQKADDKRQDLWAKQMQVNVLAAVQITEALIPLLKAAGPSSIVNVSSGLGLRPSVGMSAYSATKAAMKLWSECLALELGPHQIRVNCVCPGLVDTPIHAFYNLPPEQRKKAKDSMAELQPLGRIGEPEEIAEAIAFLASDKSHWTTGATLTVDGGINLK